LRLYLLCAPDGMPVSFCLAPANEPEREVAAAMLERARERGLLTDESEFRRPWDRMSLMYQSIAS
jgi:hypothetical protein